MGHLKNNEKPTVVDLFSGCGGLSYGLEMAGFKILLGADNWSIALETFLKNHKSSKTLLIDLGKKSAIEEIAKSLDGISPDVIVGGPPCQGFSLTGPRKFDDPRNRLFMSEFRAVKKFKPLAFLIENVPGMATLYDGKIRKEVIKRFEAIGYSVNSKVLCAADYGVPQLRKRLVYVGVLKEIGKFEFPEPTVSSANYITCGDAINDLPSRENNVGLEFDVYDKKPQTEYQRTMRAGSDSLWNHVASLHSEKVKNVISMVPEGGNYKNLPPGVGEHRKFHVAWTRYDSKKPSKTIDTGHRNHFHYKYNRIPTVRENARLQSFPDSFVFLGTRVAQQRQVGNAVPPILSYNIGMQLLRLLKS